MLRDLAELTQLEEADPQSFRVRAYESAAQAIAAQASDLGKLTVAELRQIQGIGKSTADAIRELLETGRVEKLEELRRKHPRDVVALLRVPGLGPKAVKRLRAELGVQSIDDLRRALAEQRVRGLAGFGAKSEEKLAQALARLAPRAPSTGRRSRSHSRSPTASSSACSRCRASRTLRTAARCGASRETIGDVDIVVAAGEPRRGHGGARLDERRRARARARRRRRRASSRSAGRRWTCASWRSTSSAPRASTSRARRGTTSSSASARSPAASR